MGGSWLCEKLKTRAAPLGLALGLRLRLLLINFNYRNMAKSLRSKWKRKMRAEKRIRYGEKERAKLEKMLESYKNEKSRDGNEKEAEMKDESKTDEIIEVLAIGEEQVEKMDTRTRAHNSKTLRDENGTYPVWMSVKKIQKSKAMQKMNKAKFKGTEGKIQNINNRKNNRNNKKPKRF